MSSAAFSLCDFLLFRSTNGVQIAAATKKLKIASTNPQRSADPISPPNPTGVVHGIRAITGFTKPIGPINSHVIIVRTGITSSNGIISVTFKIRG